MSVLFISSHKVKGVIGILVFSGLVTAEKSHRSSEANLCYKGDPLFFLLCPVDLPGHKLFRWSPR